MEGSERHIAAGRKGEEGRGKGLSIEPAWERVRVRFYNRSEIGLRLVGRPEVDYLLLDVLPIIT